MYLSSLLRLTGAYVSVVVKKSELCVYVCVNAGWCAANIACWKFDKFGKIPGVNSSDSWCREGTVQVNCSHISYFPNVFFFICTESF